MLKHKRNKPYPSGYIYTYPWVLGLIVMAVGIAPFFTNLNIGYNDQFATLLRKSIDSKKPSEIDFMSIPPIEPIYIGQLNSSDVPYLVSFPWWDGRINKTNFIRKTAIWAHPTVRDVQKIIADTQSSDIFVDVGANVGFMCNYAINSGRPVYAIEPISWNVAKIAEGVRANVDRGWANPDFVDKNFHLYHAAAGPKFMSLVNITRPSDSAGHFDASSLSRKALSQEDIVTEHIPMLTVDSIIPENKNVGAVKIDVQGHEFGVLLGMKKILGREVGYPKYVFYEDDKHVTELAGYKHGECEAFLKSFGYHCYNTIGGDKECRKG